MREAIVKWWPDHSIKPDESAFSSREAFMSALQRGISALEPLQREPSVDIPEDLLLVSADRTAMVLLLDNLIDNAVRYSATRRRLEICARAEERHVTIEVRDHGQGIPEDELLHVTRKFFRGRHAGSGGTGLGLAIVRNIIVDHGGTLTIRSTVGLGTTVTVTLRSAAMPARASSSQSQA